MHVFYDCDVFLQILVEKLMNKGLVVKPNRGFRDDVQFVEESEEWMKKYDPKILDRSEINSYKRRYGGQAGGILHQWEWRASQNTRYR